MSRPIAVIKAILREAILATQRELSDFLIAAERRAFKQAVFAVRNEESALDIVQESMMKLAEKYGDRPAEEFPVLFQRIMQNTIRDFYRRNKVRSFWTILFSAFSPDEADDPEAIEALAQKTEFRAPDGPEEKLIQAQTLNLIEDEIKMLPQRQREAFLMRYWEEMDVAETALAMGCSQGSVKTHCSRAVHTLAEALKAKGITL
jgi:RNA polymerase sigma-70 factor (ECF subfamily)